MKANLVGGENSVNVHFYMFRAVASFDEMLHSTRRHLLQYSVREVTSIGVDQ